MSPPPREDRGAGQSGGAGRKSMLLRLAPEVHAALASWAADDLRSTNAHVEWLLRRALAEAGRLPSSRPAPGDRRRRTRDAPEGDEHSAPGPHR